MDILLVLPIIVPFIMAIISVINWGQRQLQRFIAFTSTTVQVLVGVVLLLNVYENGIQTTNIGSWPAPFGIVIVADMFSAIMVMVSSLIGLTVVIYSLAAIDSEREHFGYYPAVLFLLMGASGAFLAGDMFNLYVWFEIILISSFLLLSLGGTRAQLEGAVKYFALNLLISAFFLTGVGMLYSVTGALNMADLAVRIPQVPQSELIPVVSMFFLVAFGIKAAAFPLYFWLPASYHTPPVAVTTLFSGLMTKVGVYAMIRVFSLMFTQDVPFTHNLILIIAAFTMVTGVLGAVAQYDFRRLLSFHIISQIGYLLMGLGLFTAASLAATVFFMVHVIIAKSALFLVSGLANLTGKTYDLKKLGSLYKGYPFLALLFLLPALSLAGIPPLSGFWAKYALIEAGLAGEQYVVVLVALGVSILTLFSMTKIWAEAFWKDSPNYDEEDVARAARSIPRTNYRMLVSPLVVLVILTVVIGLFAEPVYQMAMAAGNQLIQPEHYIRAVLGGAN